MRVGLVHIDIQNDYFPNGKMELEGSEQAGEIAGGLLSFLNIGWSITRTTPAGIEWIW